MSDIAARIGGEARRIGGATWDALANPNGDALPHPFTRHAFIAALEDSGSATAKTGWRPVHLVLERAGRPIGLLPLYLKNHSYGEYVFDHGWAEAFARAGGRYYPKLQAGVPFTPVTGNRLLVGAGENEADVRRLQTGAERTANERIAQLTRRLTSESEENTRLKKALADAQAKLDAIARLGAAIIAVPYDVWWSTMQDHEIGRAHV